MTKSTADRPTISFLDPSTVPRGWEGTVKVFGTNFDEGSFVFFDGNSPKTIFKSTSLLEAEVKQNITDTPGAKQVKVHTGNGDLSDPVDFTVEQRGPYST